MSPRTPLLRPGRYFDERGVSLARGLAVVALVTAAMVAGVYGMGLIFTERIDGAVTVDNPERPPDAFCEGSAGSEQLASSCDEPKEVKRDIDEFLWKAVGKSASGLVLGLPIVWLFVGGLLHAGSWLAGGEGSARNSWAVAAWGLAPGVAGFAVGLVVLALTFDPVTVSSSAEPAALRREVIDSLGALEVAGTVTGVATTLWGAVIWRVGLQEGRNVGGTAASAVAGAAALLVWLFGAA
ncbi:YIP1 family protein [Halostella sp. JP-L12]|uniref:Yip1 family protein n=1 Tax=Halostella TaxID=1843185 RepID=UPI000EF83502|nr:MULTISPECIES: Yip1 family protein [Halostella]NHN46635.1 YIP1 family protein [Halostella sp. JP-L12]